jgi:GNAT superfamily N-acetyltransferase
MTPASEILIIPVTDDVAAHEPWLLAGEALHRQLRPSLPADYAGHMKRMFAEGAEMAVLVDELPRALAVYRRYLTTYHGRRFYIDDLVTDEQSRSRLYGGRLLAWCEARARETGCDWLDLDSGVHRNRAHRFYFRNGLSIGAFSFSKPLT